MSRAPSLRIWIAGARPRTLPAAVVPVAVGAAVAVDDSGWSSVSWAGVVLALVVSLLLQVGVNYANDYSDGVRGTDDVRVGPLRLVASGSATPQQVRAAALTSLLLASVAGCALAAMTSWWLIAVGVAAVLAAWGYTGGPKPYGYLGLGEVFVFVFFRQTEPETDKGCNALETMSERCLASLQKTRYISGTHRTLVSRYSLILNRSAISIF